MGALLKTPPEIPRTPHHDDTDMLPLCRETQVSQTAEDKNPGQHGTDATEICWQNHLPHQRLRNSTADKFTSVVRETGVSLHNWDPIEGPPYSPRYHFVVLFERFHVDVLNWDPMIARRLTSLGQTMRMIDVVSPVRRLDNWSKLFFLIKWDVWLIISKRSIEASQSQEFWGKQTGCFSQQKNFASAITLLNKIRFLYDL